MALLFKSDIDRGDSWRRALLEFDPGLDLREWPEIGDPADIDYALVWRPPPGELKSYPNLKVIFSVGAGIDHLSSDPDLPAGVPVVRMVEPELTRGMTEYIVLHVLRHHRRQREMEANQRAEKWEMISVPTAPSRKVGVMGLGELGGAAALALTALEFDVAGWSRSPKEFPGVECFHGDFGMDAFLARTEILICLLPLTAETEGILNAELFAKLPKGASLINAARGGHQVEEDILAALDRGQLSETTLDVFREEPLPAGHPCWRHPRVTITPHNASLTDPDGAVRQVIENIQRIRRGEPPSNIVDSKAGY
ncbi:MAG: glyoxylate/hydroxypyruvate reductase A [Alphaproteobacteria bacterium]|nr:glyoxylate/hydroxypyruvate reductase A [Alphaproteobacteria bacterium]